MILSMSFRLILTKVSVVYLIFDYLSSSTLYDFVDLKSLHVLH